MPWCGHLHMIDNLESHGSVSPANFGTCSRPGYSYCTPFCYLLYAILRAATVYHTLHPANNLVSLPVWTLYVHCILSQLKKLLLKTAKCWLLLTVENSIDPVI